MVIQLINYTVGRLTQLTDTYKADSNTN